MEEFTIVVVRRENLMVYRVAAFKGHLTNDEAINKIKEARSSMSEGPTDNWIIKHMRVSEMD